MPQRRSSAYVLSPRERAIENFQIGSSISETEDVSTLEEWLKNSINDIKRTTDATTPPKKLSRPRK